MGESPWTATERVKRWEMVKGKSNIGSKSTRKVIEQE